jgi:hypothetical protein
VRFLENHDEARIASRLSMPEQKAAAVLLLAQPGLRLLHDGQWAGLRRHTPVQFDRYWPEPANAEIAAFYDRMLPLFGSSFMDGGETEFGETGVPHCFAMKCEKDGGWLDLALVNLAPQRASFPLREVKFGREIATLFSDPDSTWSWREDILQINLAACGFELLELRPASAE